MHDALWTLTNVTLGRGQPRLADVTLTIRPGRTAIIGPSGAGKTSLLNLLVEYERPDSGQVESALDSRGSQLPIGWVPADFGLWPHMSVREHVEAVSTEDVELLLTAFRLIQLASSNVAQLSQGERSRLAVARALASDSQVLVLDEPLVHVDPVHLDDDWRVIRDHCRAKQTSLVFTTHSPEVVLREAENVVCLDGGNVIYDGSVDELHDRPPSATLARFLGPANWFDDEDAARWLSNRGPTASPSCVRPERLELYESPGSPLVIESTLVAPAVTVSQIKDERNADVRTVYHRTTSSAPNIGEHVLLRICALLLMALSVAGCQPSSAAPALDVVAARTLKMPVAGSTIAAPRSLTVSEAGEVFVLDKAGRVLVYASDGSLDRQWHMPEHEIGKPEGLCILEDGRIAVADTHYHRVVFFDQKGTVLGMFGELGEGPGQFVYPVSITRDCSGHLYVAEYGGNDRIQKFTTDGEHLLTMGSFGTDAGQFQRPSGVVWSKGMLYVADAINNRVQVFAEDGTFSRVLAGWGGSGSATDGTHAEESSTISLDYPYDIALGPDGHLFVVEYGAGRVTSMTVTGKPIGQHGNPGRGDGQFWTPWGIAVGGDGRIFVADTGNKRIVELTL